MKRWWPAAGALTAIVIVAYAPSFGVPFRFDDWHVIEQNPAAHDVAQIPAFFSGIETFSILPGNRDYRPVFLTSMALSWWVGGGSTVPFHIVSVLLHVGNALMLASILGWLLARERDPVGGLPESTAKRVGLAAGLLFGLHPLTTEAVVYVSSQSILLAAFFSLLSLRLFLWARERHGPGPSLGSWAAYALALLSKPTAFMLPVILALWELLFGARVKGGAKEKPSWWRRLARQSPYWLVSLGYLGLRAQVFADVGGFSEATRSRFVQVLTQTKALVFYYLRMALAPFGHSVDRDYPLSTSLGDPLVIAALAVLIAVGVGLLRFRRHANLVFWTLWFPTWLFITTYGAVLMQVVREGRAYLALAGVCALAAMGFERVHRWALSRSGPSPERRRRRRRLTLAAAGLIVGALAAGTFAQSLVWTSNVSLWGQAAERGGTWRAHMNYGLALESAELPDEALAAFERAVELGPYAYAHLNLGLALVRRDRVDEGLWHLRHAVSLWPSSPETHRFLAWGLERAELYDEARRELLRTLQLRPNDLQALSALAGFHERRGELDEALSTYRRLATLAPRDEGVVEAIQRLERGAPRDGADALFGEAFEAQRAGERGRAIQLYEQLIEVAPDHRQGRFNLAYALMNGDSREDWLASASHFERVLQIDPTYAEVWFHLGTVRRQLGQIEAAVEADRRYLREGWHADLRQRASERLGGGE